MIREMKDSGVETIGAIPYDWRVIPLKYQVSCNDDVLSESTSSSYIFKYVEIGAVSLEKGITKYKTQSFFNAPSRARRIVKCEDVIISTVRTYLRAIAVIDDDTDVIVSTGFAVLRPKKIVPNFLGYALKSSSFIENVISNSYGVSYPAINSSDLVRLHIPVPSQTEQQQIVHFLDRKCTAIDTAIEKTKKSIEKLEEYKKAVITKAVTKGIDPNAKMKDSGVEWIGEIPEGMDIIRIKFISDIFGRIGFRGYTQNDLVNEGDGAISLSPSNLKSFRMSYDKCTYISWSKYEESPEIKIENGDILFVKTGSSYGKSCIVKDLPEKATINPQLIVFKNIKCNNKYLFYLLQTWIVDTQTQWYVTGGTIPTMSQDKIANFYLPYYKDNYKQQQIVHFLDRKCTAIDNAIEKKKKAIEKWEEYKKSLICYAVTGKIDCRNEVI